MMSQKFDDVPVEKDTRILFRHPAKFGKYDVLYEMWSWGGIQAESIIFVTARRSQPSELVGLVHGCFFTEQRQQGTALAFAVATQAHRMGLEAPFREIRQKVLLPNPSPTECPMDEQERRGFGVLFGFGKMADDFKVHDSFSLFCGFVFGCGSARYVFRFFLGFRNRLDHSRACVKRCGGMA